MEEVVYDKDMDKQARSRKPGELWWWAGNWMWFCGAQDISPYMHLGGFIWLK